ncbi:NAD(P)-binding oxidoreductase [Gallibacterium salpingitidis]|uniref:NAD(P)-binding domain-containing protein n=1 Tax=Gallibacterium salpingitidis TaxID=505341 RepID=A0A1A7NR64_9PAST|nr:NAD(P)H-binding protein [Gallibacterium salpingitidis]OBW92702.1 hypothetical protein QS62_08465 [Gallibacterium salpingitidis]
MKKVLLIGATGSLGRVIANYLEQKQDILLSVLARRPQLLPNMVKAKIFHGAVEDQSILLQALQGQDAVIFCLSGDLPKYFAKVRYAMHQQQVQRIIVISSIGIYDEPIKPILKPYRHLADDVERSGLEYTIIRPDWFTYDHVIDYQITEKGQQELPGAVSRLSIADYIYHALFDIHQIGKNIGISCPNLSN